ncbi:protein FAM162A-like [Hylaeus anthracinus]|uniref:protein FAM162A-like n=1 Tax=Hylaeus anthracinus TaxID=313031 RepID=UPI0023B976C2|nr:protein FAM162A-like [Hylaeus anthracinus]
MFRTLVMRQLKLSRIRQLHSTPMSKNKGVIEKEASKPKVSEAEQEENLLGAPMHLVTNFDKRILVLVKRYPSMDAVPRKVSYDCIKNAHSKARIYACNCMIVFAIVGFIWSAMSGKRELASGRHIISDRMKFIAEQQAKGKAEAEARAAAASKS